jgi:hypothetical protein
MIPMRALDCWGRRDPKRATQPREKNVTKPGSLNAANAFSHSLVIVSFAQTVRCVSTCVLPEVLLTYPP